MVWVYLFKRLSKFFQVNSVKESNMLIVRHLYQFGISSEFLVIEPERNCVCSLSA